MKFQKQQRTRKTTYPGLSLMQATWSFTKRPFYTQRRPRVTMGPSESGTSIFSCIQGHIDCFLMKHILLYMFSDFVDLPSS